MNKIAIDFCVERKHERFWQAAARVPWHAQLLIGHGPTDEEAVARMKQIVYRSNAVIEEGVLRDLCYFNHVEKPEFDAQIGLYAFKEEIEGGAEIKTSDLDIPF